MSISLGGLASGLDTEAIVSQLMQLERRSGARLAVSERQAQVRQDALRDIQTKLTALRDAAAGLRSASVWQDVQTVDSSSTSVASARRIGAAGIGTYGVEVVSLARGEQRSYAWTDDATNDRTLSVTPAATGVAWSLAIPAGRTAQQVADAINADSAAPVYGVAVAQSDGSTRLVLSSRAIGASSGFTSTGFTEVAGTARLAADASIKIDGGTAQNFSSNVVTSAIAGVELTLRAPGTTSVTVSAPAPSTDAVVEAAKAFVAKYNEAVDAIRSRVTEARPYPLKSEADQYRGLLRGDTGLGGILSALRTDVATAVAGAVGTRDELRELGISTGAASGSSAYSAASVAGKLVLDEATLRDAVTNDRTNVRKLFGAEPGFSGFAQRFETLVGTFSGSGGTVDERVSAQGREVERLRTRQADFERRMSLTEARLRAQFTALETAMSASQTQSSWLAGQLSQL